MRAKLTWMWLCLRRCRFSVALVFLPLGAALLTGLMPAMALAAGTSGTALGDKAIALVGKDLKGKSFSLAKLRGNFVMLSFWTPDCPVCAKELPTYDAYYRKVGSERLRLVSVLLGQNLSVDEAAGIVKERGYSFPVILFAGSDMRRLIKDWNVTATPANYLINPQGIIVLKGFLGDKGLPLMKRIVEKKRDFSPPRIDVESSLTAGGNAMNYRVTIPNAADRYSFILRASARYIEDSGQLATFEEVAPVTLKLVKDARGVVQPESILETADREGQPAKLTNPALVRIDATRIGKTVRLEVTAPLPVRAPLVLAEVKFYSKTLGGYITLDSGYPT